MTLWLFALLPFAAALVGAAWTHRFAPRPATVGAIQHFAAGVVFFAAAGELLPEVIARGGIAATLVGGGLGIAAMLALRRFGEGGARRRGLVVAMTIDAAIDGLVLGLAFLAGGHAGALLAMALGIEFLFLGLAVATALPEGTSWRRIYAATGGMALAVVPGVAAAQPIGLLPDHVQAGALAFGLVALLYLVSEELLTEAHEKPETSWGTAMFFVGFLALAALGEAMAG